MPFLVAERISSIAQKSLRARIEIKKADVLQVHRNSLNAKRTGAQAVTQIYLSTSRENPQAHRINLNAKEKNL